MTRTKPGDLHQGPGLSIREIAKILGISHARVSQIERQALRKLARLLSERHLTKESFTP